MQEQEAQIKSEIDVKYLDLLVVFCSLDFTDKIVILPNRPEAR